MDSPWLPVVIRHHLLIRIILQLLNLDQRVYPEYSDIPAPQQ